MTRDPAEIARRVAERGRERNRALLPLAAALRAERRGDSSRLDGLREAAKARAEVSALAERRIPGFFPTPRGLARLVVERADVRDGHNVLEPSAGAGHLVDAVRAAAPGAALTVVEISPALRTYLIGRGLSLAGDDFLAFTGGPFDRIVMNPPFEHGQDIAHVRHAFDLLADGGRLVAIMCAGPFFRADRQSREFRAWLEGRGGIHEPIADGAFLSSERPTGVRSVLVEIDR